jgi:hypothetical protein
MSTTTMALNEKPRGNIHTSISPAVNSPLSNESQSISDLKSLGKNDKITVNKVNSSTEIDTELNNEFLNNDESEFNLASKTPKEHKISAAGNTTTITVSTTPSANTPSANTPSANTPSANTPSANTANIHVTDKNATINTHDELNIETENEHDLYGDKPNEANLNEENKDDDEEKTAAELVAAAAAQIANKSLKKPITTKPTAKTIKATGKMLESGNQEKIMKKAMLMLNESGHINVVTEEQTPSIVKLNTPANKAQIKLKTFRQNFEKQLAEMRRKSPIEIQKIKTELANIEFAEIGNKNIITGLLELIDDHELKLLTIEKMLKNGDITLNF